MSLSIFNNLDNGDAFFLCLMGKHCASDNIPNSVDMRHCCLELVIDFNSSGFILLDSDSLQIEVLGVGNSSNGDHNVLSFQSGSLLSLFLSGGDFDSALHHLMRFHLSIGEDLHSLLLECCGEFLNHIGVVPRDNVTQSKNCDFCSKAIVNGNRALSR